MIIAESVAEPVTLSAYRFDVGPARDPTVPATTCVKHRSVIYYMLEGSATLVTGGRIVDETSSGVSPNTQRPNFGGPRIEDGASRRVVPGDVVIIPGNSQHWWSSLDSDIRYLIVRPDPEGLQPVR